MPRKESPKKAAPAPAPKKPSTSPRKTDEKKAPGLLAQAASTATGAAIGAAVGHTIGHKLAGGGKKDPGSAVQCDVEWKAFVACSEKKADQTECKQLLQSFTHCLNMHNKAD